MVINIPLFNPQLARNDAMWAIIGPRGSGKSCLLKDLLYRTKDMFNIGYADVGSLSALEMCREFLPHDNVTLNQNKEALQGILSDVDRINHALFVEDDLASKHLRNTEQDNLYTNGRHLKISKFTTCQTIIQFPQNLRSNLDYIFFAYNSNLDDQKRIWEKYCGGISSFQEFQSIFKQTTKDHSFIVIDNTTTNDSIFYYKASLDIPSFQIGDTNDDEHKSMENILYGTCASSSTKIVDDTEWSKINKILPLVTTWVLKDNITERTLEHTSSDELMQKFALFSINELCKF